MTLYFCRYNEIFVYFWTEVFSKMIDMQHIMDRNRWLDNKGRQKGTSPMFSTYIHPDFPGSKDEAPGFSLLSPPLLTYLDFLVADAPWFNGIDGPALEEAEAVAEDHGDDGAKELHRLLKKVCAKGTSAQKPVKRRRLIMDSDDEEAKEREEGAEREGEGEEGEEGEGGA